MNLQTLKQRTKLGNSGFSLVELIIVIAIMAILIAVLAPMFIRYVERSRQSNDLSTIGSMARALEAAAADPNLPANSTGIWKLTWTGSSGVYQVDPSAYAPEVQSTVGGSGTVTPDSAAMKVAVVEITFNINNNTKTYTATTASGNVDFDTAISNLNN